jgi:hypothetical protein
MNSILDGAEGELSHIDPALLKPDSFGWPATPYKGLNYFSFSDAPLFGQRDTEVKSCASIIGASTNRVFLLQGRSGAGKSSFLRAGLLPRLAEAKLALMRPGIGREPILIRCTEDPIWRICEQLREVVQSRDAPHFIPPADLMAAKGLFVGHAQMADRQITAESIIAGLQLLLKNSTRPLVIVVDQCEEIFTLAAASDPINRRKAFFGFLEELCGTNVRVKLILSLRTEYYGQFCDNLRFEPNTTISHTRTGLDQFMLKGLRSQEQIVAAISRPTSKMPLPPYGIPYNHYNFSFGDGVAEQIAKDLIELCGESSILPVLQIVCKDLYQRIVLAGKRSTISMADYVGLGRVEGRVKAFMSDTIRRAIKETEDAGQPPASVDVHNLIDALVFYCRYAIDRFVLPWLLWRSDAQKVAKWEYVISTLVARQEGGALTTLLADEKDLLKEAKKVGIRNPSGLYLEKLAEEELRLLRSVNCGDGEERRYSLGHDSLAPALLHWRVTQEQGERERKKLRRVLVIVGVIGLLVILQSYYTRYQSVEFLSTVSEQDTSPSFAPRIRLLVAALNQSDGILGIGIPRREVSDRLKEIIMRAPIQLGQALAVGISRFSNEMALLESSGEVTVQKLGEEIGERVLVGKIPISSSNPGFAQTPVIGYIRELRKPIVYDRDTLYWWQNDDSPTTEPKFLPITIEESPSRNWRIADFSGGVFRINVFSPPPPNGRDRKVFFKTFTYNTQKQTFEQLPKSGSLSVPFPYQPALSQTTDAIAFLHDGLLQIGSRSDTDPPHIRDLAVFKSGGEQRFIQGLTFTTGEQPGVAVRNTLGQFTAFTLPTNLTVQKTLNFYIPPPLWDWPVTPISRFLRPVLAATASPNGWQLAWVGQGGILVLKANELNACEIQPWIRWRLDVLDVKDIENSINGATGRELALLPAVPLDTIFRMDFVENGKFLILQQQRSYADPVNFRIWDLSDRYIDSIRALAGTELKNKACTTVSLENANDMAQRIKSGGPTLLERLHLFRGPFDVAQLQACGRST